jgi:hypothetical protein
MTPAWARRRAPTRGAIGAPPVADPAARMVVIGGAGGSTRGRRCAPRGVLPRAA